jgi:general secretion pathway protein G
LTPISEKPNLIKATQMDIIRRKFDPRCKRKEKLSIKRFGRFKNGGIMNNEVPRYRTHDRGFTLIELMVVIVILGILAGLIVPRIMGRPEEAKQLKSKMQIESISTALKLFKLDSGNYPTTAQGLQALVEQPESGNLSKNWRKGGYLDKIPKDPWGNDYLYVSPGVHGDFDISSYGGDGVAGGEDKDKDINSWEIE